MVGKLSEEITITGYECNSAKSRPLRITLNVAMSTWQWPLRIIINAATLLANDFYGRCHQSLAIREHLGSH